MPVNPLHIVMVVIGLPVVCATLVILTVIIINTMKKQRAAGSPSSEETRMIQEMHQSLLRMEKRIDALETIYFETDKNQKGTTHERQR